jgi:hypothetical protein
MSILSSSSRPYRGKQTRDDDEGCGPLYLVVCPRRIAIAFRHRMLGIELYVGVADCQCAALYVDVLTYDVDLIYLASSR